MGELNENETISSDKVDSVEHSNEQTAKASKWTVDMLLDALGSPGRCQTVIYILMCLNVFPVSLNFMAMSLFGKSPNQTCKLPNGWLMNTSIPMKKDGSYEGCIMYKDPSNTSLGTQSCINGYEYHLTDGRYPITAQWDLVCDQEWLVRAAQSIFFAGVMIGGLIFGYLGDYFGRKPVTLFTLYCQATLAIVLSFSPHLAMFMTLKFFQGMMLQGLQTSNTTAVMELYQTRYRTKAGMGVAMLATSCSMVIGLIYFLIPHWRYLQLAISVPTVITISFIWLLPESLRWLLSKQKFKEAKKISESYIKFNKVSTVPDLEKIIEDVSLDITNNSQQSVNKNIMDLFKISSVRRSSIVLFYLWFTASVVYYGITFSNTFLNGNPSLNFFVVGALETTSRFAGYFIINRFGRRIPMSVCYILSGVVCIISGCIGKLLESTQDNGINTLTIILVLVGRAAMGQCFAFIAIVTSEVFPTVLRTVGSGTCSMWSRVGGMIAPLALLLDKYVGKATPIILFGSLAIIGGGLTLLLPETLNVPLPDTVTDAKNVHSHGNNANNAQSGQVNVAMDDHSLQGKEK